MSETDRPLPRTGLSAEERRLRSQLHRILNDSGLMHGTLIRRRRLCGKPNCRCTRGRKHEGLYVVVTEGGKPRQLYVPPQWEQTVRRWIDAYQRARQLLDEVSRMHWQKVRKRKD
jgi:hypothetical protein